MANWERNIRSSLPELAKKVAGDVVNKEHWRWIGSPESLSTRAGLLRSASENGDTERLQTLSQDFELHRKLYKEEVAPLLNEIARGYIRETNLAESKEIPLMTCVDDVAQLMHLWHSVSLLLPPRVSYAADVYSFALKQMEKKSVKDAFRGMGYGSEEISATRRGITESLDRLKRENPHSQAALTIASEAAAVGSARTVHIARMRGVVGEDAEKIQLLLEEAADMLAEQLGLKPAQ